MLSTASVVAFISAELKYFGSHFHSVKPQTYGSLASVVAHEVSCVADTDSPCFLLDPPSKTLILSINPRPSIFASATCVSFHFVTSPFLAAYGVTVKSKFFQ